MAFAYAEALFILFVSIAHILKKLEQLIIMTIYYDGITNMISTLCILHTEPLNSVV